MSTTRLILASDILERCSNAIKGLGVKMELDWIADCKESYDRNMAYKKEHDSFWLWKLLGKKYKTVEYFEDFIEWRREAWDDWHGNLYNEFCRKPYSKDLAALDRVRNLAAVEVYADKYISVDTDDYWLITKYEEYA